MANCREYRAETGWHVERLDSALLVCGNAAQLVECWAVVAEQPLDELLLELTADDPPGDPAEDGAAGDGAAGDAAAGPGPVTEPGTVQISYGGELLPEPWPPAPDGRRVVGVRLPRPLDPGEAHEFRLTARIRSARPPTRHVFLPFVPCDVVEMRVRFGDGGPADTWLVDGVPLTPARTPVPLDPLTTQLPVDGVGESSALFRRPRLGLAHGLQWWPGTGPGPGPDGRGVRAPRPVESDGGARGIVPG